MKEVILDYEENKIVVRFKYDEELVKKVKSISMRKWDYINKRWIFPFVISKYEEILKTFEGGYKIIITDRLRKEVEKNTIRKIDITGIDEDLKVPLYSFQKEAVAFLKDAGGKGIIAYEMGLGKTAIAIAYVHSYSLYPALIVCPKMLIHHWEREIYKFIGKKEVNIMTNGDLSIKDFNIINYDRLKKIADLFKDDIPFKTIIFDESHFLKNYKAERTRLAIQISKKCENLILLTGTPLLNRPIELYTQIKIVNPHLFDYKNFIERYCDAKIVQVHTRNGIKKVKDVKGASNLDELKEKLKSIMIRKLKKDVLTELPSKTISVIPFITDLKEYQHLLFSPELFNEVQKYEEYIKKIEENAEKEIIRNIEEEFNKVQLHGFIEKLKQEAVKSKLEQTIEFINNTLEQNEKVVVFVHHRFVVEELKKAFPEALIITGETLPAERVKNLDEFTKNPDKHLLIASIRVAGYGLNLSVSNTAIFLEFDWNYHTHLQCEDRLHRIGQTQPVNIYYLVAVGTIEEKICQLIDAKRKVVASAIDDLKTELLSRVDMLKNLAEYLMGEIKK